MLDLSGFTVFWRKCRSFKDGKVSVWFFGMRFCEIVEGRLIWEDEKMTVGDGGFLVWRNVEVENEFIYNNQKLECIDEFIYLGICFTKKRADKFGHNKQGNCIEKSNV